MLADLKAVVGDTIHSAAIKLEPRGDGHTWASLCDLSNLKINSQDADGDAAKAWYNGVDKELDLNVVVAKTSTFLLLGSLKQQHWL